MNEPELRKTVIEFGINAFLYKAINYLLMLILGWILQIPLETVLFILLYSKIRGYAGGQHFESKKVCFYSSFVIVLLLALFLLLVEKQFIIQGCYIIIPLCVVVIWMLSPCDNYNNILDDYIKFILRKKVRLMLVILSAAVMPLLVEYPSFAYTIVFVMFIESLGLVWGTINNKTHTSKKII